MHTVSKKNISMLGGRVYLCLPIEWGKNERKKKNQVKADYDACEADRSKF